MMNIVGRASERQTRAQQAWLQGRAFGERGAWQKAADHYRVAVRLEPSDALYGLNLADALLKAGRNEDAVKAACAARAAEPANRLATAIHARTLLQSLKYEELILLLTEAPSDHVDSELLSWKGLAEFKVGNPKAAVHTLLQAVMQAPQAATLHYWLGLAFNELSLKREAAECFRTALVLGLGNYEVGVRDLLAFYEREICDWRGGDTQVQALKTSIANLSDTDAVPTNPFAHVTLLDDPVAQLRAARACARHIAREVTPLAPRRPKAKERLRIGYVSADFHQHATSFLMVHLLEKHDRERFEIFLYSHGKDDGSDMRTRILAAADHFVEAKRMTVPAMARQIRQDGIDILVDLKGYTKDSRPALFAHRAAPIQVAYLGFPGTSGAESIDYIIGDPYVTPLSHAGHFSEKIAQLPDCYQCNDGTRRIPTPPSRSSQGLPEHAFVLCGFNQPYKISPEVFDTWCRILERVPHAVLWLLEWHPQARASLQQAASARGIDVSRLYFAATIGQEQHLDRIGCADLFLDTWPCNGHTTASDMLWAGVPVVTLSGQTFASRVAGSLLTALGLEELICRNADEYETLALELSRNCQRLGALRRRVREGRGTSALFDSSRLAPSLERLYQRMWARAVAGLAVDHLPA